MERPWVGKKICINGPGHMSKMAATPIYAKTFKNLLLQNREFCDLETWHAALGLKFYKDGINDEPWLTLTYFTAWSKLVACKFEWETLLQSSSMGENLQQMSMLTNIYNIFLRKEINPGLVCPCSGPIHFYDHYFKHLFLCCIAFPLNDFLTFFPF